METMDTMTFIKIFDDFVKSDPATEQPGMQKFLADMGAATVAPAPEPEVDEARENRFREWLAAKTPEELQEAGNDLRELFTVDEELTRLEAALADSEKAEMCNGLHRFWIDHGDAAGAHEAPLARYKALLRIVDEMEY